MEQPNDAFRWRAAAAAALAWAGLAAVWAAFGPGPAAVPDGISGILRSCLVLPLAEELVFRGAALRLLQPLGGGWAVVVQVQNYVKHSLNLLIQLLKEKLLKIN